MFEIGKKGMDKGQNAMAIDDQASKGPAAAEPMKRPAAAKSEPAVIGPSIRIDGDVRGEEDLLIEGEVKGTVHLKDNNLVVGTQGRLRANVYARSIDIEGLTDGDVHASERVNIRKSAQVNGNIIAPRISLEDGARFKGSIEMDPQAVEAALGTSRGNVATLSSGAKPSTGGKPGGEPSGGKPDHVATQK